MYPKDIDLEIETSGLEQVFLNLKLVLENNKLKIYMYNQNFEYALGRSSEQAVLRIGPYLGTPWAQTAVRLYVQTRIATMVQLYHQGVYGLDQTFIELISELVQLGTPVKVIDRILRSFTGLRSHQIIDTARRKLRKVEWYVP